MEHSHIKMEAEIYIMSWGGGPHSDIKEKSLRGTQDKKKTKQRLGNTDSIEFTLSST